MKNKYNIKHNHREKGRYAGQFQNKGFIPVKKEKINFSIGDIVKSKKETWMRGGEFVIKKIFYNKYNELKYILKSNNHGIYVNEYEHFSFEIQLLPLTRKVLIEKYNKQTIEFQNGSFIVSGSTYSSSMRIYVDSSNLVQSVDYFSLLPSTRGRGRW